MKTIKAIHTSKWSLELFELEDGTYDLVFGDLGVNFWSLDMALFAFDLKVQRLEGLDG